MLHHVTGESQPDAVLAEMYRVLRPAGVLVGEDSLASAELEALHADDMYEPIDPATFAVRLRRAGFNSVQVNTNEHAVRFRATKGQE